MNGLASVALTGAIDLLALYLAGKTDPTSVGLRDQLLAYRGTIVADFDAMDFSPMPAKDDG